ncbi:MAG: 2'-5' RNA ligase family protein [candidate division Zixibacteria bacterium]|nr:2'-5' RNA ligase family protein [candidate division Zixibacteria bacterium]
MQYGYRQVQLEGRGSTRFAIVMFLPDSIETLVRPIRERFDPDYSLVSGSLVLVAPFETVRSLGELTQIIRKETADISAPEIQFERLGDAYPSAPLIFWEIKPNDVIDRLYKNLYAALDLALPYRQFSPHVTVAREISDHRVMLVKERIYPYLPEESFTPGAVDLIAPVAGQSWVSVRTFPLRVDE